MKSKIAATRRFIAAKAKLLAMRMIDFFVRIGVDSFFGAETVYEVDGYAIVIRKWGGKSYLVGSWEMPPQHFNCRCVMIPVGDKGDSEK